MYTDYITTFFLQLQNILRKAQKLLGKSKKLDKALANIKESILLKWQKIDINLIYFSILSSIILCSMQKISCWTLNTLRNSISHCLEHLAMKHAVLPLKQNGSWTRILKSCTRDRREDTLNQSKEKKLTACVHEHSVQKSH